MHRLKSIRFGTALLLVVAGCSRFNRTPPVPATPSDANIAAIVLAANNTDISYAKLAPARAEAPAIKDFAARMLADHGAVDRAMHELLDRMQLTPEENKTSLDFRDDGTDKRDRMRDLEGHAFDTTYIANEITYHSKLLDALDKILIPDARDPTLKQTLTSIRPAVASHLQHAQRVQAALAK